MCIRDRLLAVICAYVNDLLHNASILAVCAFDHCDHGVIRALCLGRRKVNAYHVIALAVLGHAVLHHFERSHLFRHLEAEHAVRLFSKKQGAIFCIEYALWQLPSALQKICLLYTSRCV